MKRLYSTVLALVFGAVWTVMLAHAKEVIAGSSNAGPAFASYNVGMWEISVQYPNFSSTGDLALAANAELNAAAEAEFSSFLAKARAELPELREMGSPGIYALLVTPTVASDLPELCSGYVDRMEATGGANANNVFSAFNYVRDEDRVRQLVLADLFYDGSDGVAAASQAVLTEIRAWDNLPSYVADGIWTKLTAEQAQRFVITEKGLLYLFNKYELGSGAEGTHTVLVPYDKLAGLDYEGYLKPVFDEQYSHNIDVLRRGRWVLAEITLSEGTTLAASLDSNGSLVPENWIEFRDDGLSGQVGINGFSGEYRARADGTLRIDELAMTWALNPPESIASYFERLLETVTSFMLKDGRLYLQLPDEAGMLIFLNSGVDGVW